MWQVQGALVVAVQLATLLRQLIRVRRTWAIAGLLCKFVSCGVSHGCVNWLSVTAGATGSFVPSIAVKAAGDM